MSSQTVFVDPGTTSYTIDIGLVQKAAATSPGDPITGLAFNTSSLTAYYRIPPAGTLTAITLATQTVGGGYSSGGFVEVSSTNSPGKYRFDVPNAVIASRGLACITFNGAANMATHDVYFFIGMSTNVTAINGNSFNAGGPIAELGIAYMGTAQSATATTLVLPSAASFADTTCIGMTIAAFGSTQGYWQYRTVTANVGSTDTLTVDTWSVTPSGTITCILFGSSPASTSLLPSVNSVQQAGVTLNAPYMTSGTAQAGGNNTITLSSGASATNGLYDPGLIRIVSGTGVGQARMILSYDGTTKIAVVDRDWRTNPDSTSVYEVTGLANILSTNEGMATGGAASTITLNASASATDNLYRGQLVRIPSGVGPDQVRIIVSYVGATKVATVDRAWDTTPTTASAYQIIPVADAYSVLWQSANTELAAVPGITATLADMIKWVFTLGRNKRTQTATTQLLRNDADSATIGTSTEADDGTTATRGKFV